MRTARQALARYNAQRTNRPGMCLWECQEAYGSPHRYPGAVAQPGDRSQWNNGHRVHGRDHIPLGAPVYWYNPGGWGHIALYAGNGMVRSSDAGGRGVMGTVAIDWITRHWYPRGRFLGWTRDIGGVPITFDDDPTTPEDDMTPEQDKLLRNVNGMLVNVTGMNKELMDRTEELIKRTEELIRRTGG